MRTNMLFVLSVVCLFSSLVFAVNGNMGGLTQDGSSEFPYLIEDFNDFQTFCADPNYWAAEVYTRLENDLDLNPNLPGRVIYSQAPIAGDTDTDGYFNGITFSGLFNGNDHVINNLAVSGTSFCGLLGKCDDGSEIKDLGLENTSITSSDLYYVGGLVGYNKYGNITNCYSTGSVNGVELVGGLVGYNYYGNIKSCYTTGTVNGAERVGGLVGMNYACNITSSHATGVVSGTGGSVGGLVGYNQSGSITRCHATGTVSTTGYSAGGLVGWNDAHGKITYSYSTGAVSGDVTVGGLVGDNDWSSITDSYSTGSATGRALVGGLVGHNDDGWVTSSYATGKVIGDEMFGGLVGRGESGFITNSFWDVETSGMLIGYNQSAYPPGLIHNVIGKTTAQMQTESSFIDAGWDFINIWGIGEGQTYPYFRKYSIADISCDGVVNFVDFAVIADNWLAGVE